MSADGLADLTAIRTFVAVIAAGSLGAGGRAVGLTRSAAGKAITRLEAHLGIRLLHRTTRTLRPTADGLLFHERCVVILADLADAEASVRPDRSRPRGTLRVTMPDAFGRLEILPVLADYLSRWPELRLEASVTDRRVDMVEEGFELAIRIGALPADNSLVVRVIARSRPGLFAAPDYVARFGAPGGPDDLASHRRIVYGDRADVPTWRLRTADGVEATVNTPAPIVLDNGEAMRDAARAGLGVALLPRFLAGADLLAGRLVPVLPDWAAPDLPIHAIVPARRHVPPKVRLFVELLTERLGTRAGAV